MELKKILLLFPLLIAQVSAQTGSFQSACFKGLNDVDSPATLNPCNSPDLLNTESNYQGTAIMKRKGFQKVADLIVTTSAVNGSHSFIDGSGNRLDVVCNDRYCAKSVNRNAFQAFLTTAAANVTRWSFVDVGSVLYGANNRRDPIFKNDGTNLSYPATMPAGSILELTENRLVVADVSGFPNRVYYSSAGSYENFTPGINETDPWFDEIGAPGDRIRGLKYINGNLFIFKSNSITMCDVQNQYNTNCSILSPDLGTTDPGSIVTAGDVLYFRSQDKNYWELGPSGLRQISRTIQNLVKSQSGGLGGGENSNTQTSQTDWAGGAQFPNNSWDYTAINGSIFTSSFTFVNTSSSDFNMGSVSSYSFVNLLYSTSVLRSAQWFANSGFETSQLHNQVIGASTFTFAYSTSTAGWYTPNTNSITSTGHCGVNSTGVFNYGGDLELNIGGCGSPSPVNFYINIRSIPSGTLLYVSSAGASGNASCDKYSFDLSTQTGQMQITVAMSAPSNVIIATSPYFSSGTLPSGIFEYGWGAKFPIGSGKYGNITCVSGQHNSILMDFPEPYFTRTSTYTSQAFDTSFSTPTWGPLYSNYTSSGASRAYFKTIVSNDDVTYDSPVVLSTGSRITSAQKRYFKYQINFMNSIATNTVSVSSVVAHYASTGAYRTQCIQPNVTISTWGALNCATVLTGNASIVFYATSAVNCSSLPVISPLFWQNTATNNANLTISTNAAAYIGWRSILTSSTETARVESCSLYWTEGTPAQPSWGVFDSVKNAMYWTSTINGAQYTNRLLKYDRNLEEWYPLDISAQAPKFINNNLYFGGASSGTWNIYGTVDTDNGNAINAYWRSKDIGSESPFNEKNFTRFSILSRNSGTGSMTGTYTFSNSQTGDYTISLSTGSGINYTRSIYNLPRTSPQNFLNIKFGNNSTTPFEVLGIATEWINEPIKVTNP